jgi:hypothetical protein
MAFLSSVFEANADALADWPKRYPDIIARFTLSA